MGPRTVACLVGSQRGKYRFPPGIHCFFIRQVLSTMIPNFVTGTAMVLGFYPLRG
jgi:hypothetical protein